VRVQIQMSKQAQSPRREVGESWGDALVRTGCCPQPKPGLTTFSLESVSWLECGPLAALVCSVQRPNAFVDQSAMAALSEDPINPNCLGCRSPTRTAGG